MTFVTGAPAFVHAQAIPGSGADALPGVHEVPIAVRSPQGISARLGLGYGWTESVLEMEDAHHRLQIDGAGGFTLLPWLAMSLRVLGRYDTHTGGVSDDGIVSETHLAARATFDLGPDWHAGTELALWLPGGDNVGKAFSAVSGDLMLLLAYAPELSPISIGLALGVRVDRSKDAGGDPDEYSAADRLSLGVSDSLLASRQGLAFAYRTGDVEWIAEWAFRMYFKYVAESPMWIRAGARYRPASHLQLELLLGVSPSSRPPLDEDAPLRVIEPRLAAGLSLTYVFVSQPPAAEVPAIQQPAPPPPELPQAMVRGQVLTTTGTGLPGASVALARGDARQVVESGAQGGFEFEALQAGTYTLDVTAEGFTSEQQSIQLANGDARDVQITLERELPQGQIRGTVRRFNGTPVEATVSIASLKLTLKTREDGTFEIDVPPGEYTVAVKARGLRSQTRKAKVEHHGVAILIVELEAGR